MTVKSEFHLEDAYHYDRRSPARWAVSHVWRYRGLLSLAILLQLVSLSTYGSSALLIGQAAAEMVKPGGGLLGWYALAVIAILAMDGIFNLASSYAFTNIASHFATDARQELYASLLGKSQTYHNRQRVGDLMARATDDVGLLGEMIVPGFNLLVEAVLSFTIELGLIATIDLRLLLVPGLFVIAYVFAVRAYVAELEPVIARQRRQFGHLDAMLEEIISGIEVVKASAREAFERAKYQAGARQLRDIAARQGQIEARYLPLLLYAAAVGLTFLHALWLFQQGQIGLPNVIAVMGLMAALRWPTFSSIFTFSQVQMGLAGAERILSVIKAETELDQNRAGAARPVQGDIVFEDVSFGFDGRPLLAGVSFHVRPGQTAAIVGGTGSGKSSLIGLVNRTYDVTTGRILIDGLDVRAWSLDGLRSQIGKIEQDIFLFSRSVADNIAFGRPEASPAEIQQAARDAQAHDFIMKFKDGYNTVVGERGVMLSGGQRQRLALARAFLSDPRILILDDSTSAIDSATEAEIQQALRRVQRGRTTLLITHRLAQIRWADHILVLDQGRLVADGTHDELLKRSPHYRRIFARFDVMLPALEAVGEQV
jgi:ATP-binding cassette subfamily B protein